uniref:Uncharacterized protein n=1 Tax=Caenorhabditis japonica TaxID=281687 RepID=A0A8R1EAP2_CAEJA
MKVYPDDDEMIDLRHKIHIMNAEKFIDTCNQHTNLIHQIQRVMVNSSNDDDAKIKFDALRNKGNYLCARGANNFVRYAMRLREVNICLQRLFTELKPITN